MSEPSSNKRRPWRSPLSAHAMAMARLYGCRLSGRLRAKAIGLCSPARDRLRLSASPPVISWFSFLRRHRTMKTHEHRSNAGCLALDILMLRRQQAVFVQLVQLILELVHGAERYDCRASIAVLFRPIALADRQPESTDR